MIFQTILLPRWRRFSVSHLSVNFVNHHVTAVTVIYYALARTCVTRYDDGSIRCLEAVAECLRPFTMWNKKRFDSNVLVLVHDARLNLMHVDFVSGVIVIRKVSLQPLGANLYIILPSLKDVPCHTFDAFRSKYL